MKQKTPGRKPLTKKARKEQVQAIIDRNPIGLRFDDDDLAEFNQLVERQFAAVSHEQNPTYPSDPRHVHVLDENVWIPFSWNKAISPPMDMDRADKLAGLRGVVQDDMREFLDSFENPVCGTCGCTDHPTCDHNPPFIQLAEGFMERHDVSVELLDDGGPPQIVSIDVEAAWIAYHASRVTYDLLCRSCNASKGST